MSVLRGASLAVVMAILLSGQSAAACDGSWFSSWFSRCEPEYPPMVVPPFDPQRGPAWTNNGWSHPQGPALLPPHAPMPPAPYGLEEPWRPQGEGSPLK